MSSGELKNLLIEKIKSTGNDRILEEMYRILELDSQDFESIELSDYQKSKIDKGIADFEAGRYTSNDEADKEIEEWLEK